MGNTNNKQRDIFEEKCKIEDENVMLSLKTDESDRFFTKEHRKIQKLTKSRTKPVSSKKNLRIFLGETEVDLETLNIKLMSLVTKPNQSSNMYQCIQCKFTRDWLSLPLVLEHVEHHIENLRFLCAICGFSFKTRNMN